MNVEMRLMDLDSASDRVDCPPPLSDNELYLAMQTGDQTALGAIYDRYVSLVYRLALKILSTPQEAEDLTQEIFLALWQGKTYEAGRGSLSSFLVMLTRSRAIDRLRARGRNVRFLQRWSQIMTTASPSPSPFELATINQRSELVRHALTQLAANQRQVLELAYYEGLSQTEIATRLNTPLGTVKTWSRQGLLNLKKNLQALID